MTRTALLLTAALAGLAACSGGNSKNEEARKRLAPLCAESRADFANVSGDGAEKAIITTLQVCSKACDLGDEPSCSLLDEYVAKICAFDQEICTKLAAIDSMPSLQTRAKANVKGKP